MVQNHVCPLCRVVPDDIFHIMLHCRFTDNLWREIEPTLLRLDDVPITTEEKAVGIAYTKKTPGIILRNWTTFSLRAHIMQCEREAYHSRKTPNMDTTIAKFVNNMASEIKVKILQYKNTVVEEILAYRNIICEKVGENEYHIKSIRR